MARPTIACVQFSDMIGKLYKVYIENFKEPPKHMKDFSTTVPYQIKWQKSNVGNDGFYEGKVLFLASKLIEVFFYYARV